MDHRPTSRGLDRARPDRSPRPEERLAPGPGSRGMGWIGDLHAAAGNRAVVGLLAGARAGRPASMGGTAATVQRQPTGMSITGQAERELEPGAAVAKYIDRARHAASPEDRRRELGVVVRVLQRAARLESVTTGLSTAELKELVDIATASTTSAEQAVATGLAPIVTDRESGRVSPPGERIRSALAKPLPERDAKARRLGAASYEDYVANILTGGGSLFGVSVPAANPVHPLFLEALERASQLAERTSGRRTWGLGPLAGAGISGGNHDWGTAVDIDSAAHPYIINEGDDRSAGGMKVDKDVAPVYEAIAQAMLGRASVITPDDPTSKVPTTKLIKASWTDLAEESDAMEAYFSVLSSEDLETPTRIQDWSTPRAERNRWSGTYTPTRTGSTPLVGRLTAHRFDEARVAALDRETVRGHRDRLLGLGLAQVAGAKFSTGDYPFGAGSTMGNRAKTKQDPIRGFLSIPEPVVAALRDPAGGAARWGATDFERQSGDVMHFDHNVAQETGADSKFAQYVAWGEQHQTEARRKESAQSSSPATTP